MVTKRQPTSRIPESKVGPLKQFLVAIDADGLADHALQAGLQLARTVGASIEIVHAVGSALPHWEYSDDPRAAAQDAGILSTVSKAAVTHVDRLLDDLKYADPKQVGTGAEDLVRVLAGPAAKVILDEANRLDADVIFLGSHRRRGIVDFGSTVRAVLAKAPKSVWIQTEAVGPIRRVLVPVDLSVDSLRALSHACALAKQIGASVRTIQVFQSTAYMVPAWPDYPDYGRDYVVDGVRRSRLTEFEKAMADFDWQGVAHTAEFVDGDPIDTILELSRECDLIALGTHGRTGFASILLGNVAYTVLKRAVTPVWAIRHPERQFLS
jgi:nucleotide-binding universal stress UspA family protein